jgi:hypothetical protein
MVLRRDGREIWIWGSLTGLRGGQLYGFEDGHYKKLGARLIA